MSYPKLVLERLGNPIDVIRYVEDNKSNIPEPSDDELLLENLASPIHPSIIYMINGKYKNIPDLPFTPGNDTVSVVVKKGSNVSKYNVGQRVIPCVLYGAYSQYMIVKENQILASIPNEIDIYTACQFFIIGVTAHQLVTNVVNLNAGEWALQTAAASTLGRIAIQIAKEKGIKLINVVRRNEQVRELKELGADHVIVYNKDNEDSLLKEVFDVTGGKGVKYAFDAVGGKMGTFAYRSLGEGGTIALYGLLSGEPIEVSNEKTIFMNTSVISYNVFNWVMNESYEKKLETVNDLIRLFRDKKITIKHDAVYEYKDYKKAFEEASKSKKVILVPKLK